MAKTEMVYKASLLLGVLQMKEKIQNTKQVNVYKAVKLFTLHNCLKTNDNIYKNSGL